MLDNNIIELAKFVRKQCENFVRSSKSSSYDFHYCIDLSCMCAVASFTLKHYLKKHGIKSKVIYGEFDGCDHCWLVCKGHIIDITATQFGIEEEVYVLEEGNTKGLYKIFNTQKTLHGLGWGRRQTPHASKIIPKILKCA